jgi:hypothetical protein
MVPDTECLYFFHAQNFHRVAKKMKNGEKTCHSRQQQRG